MIDVVHGKDDYRVSKYGIVAVVAARHIAETGIDPILAWKAASAEIITESRELRDKACPRGAFLGLCEEGLVKGVAPGPYHRGYKMNKVYALKGVEILGQEPELVGDVRKLWSRVVGNNAVGHHGQMDVVVELWNNGFIEAAR